MSFGAPSPARQPEQHGRAAAIGRELVVVLVALTGYFGLRVLVEGDRATAVRNAERLLEVERWLGIDVERDVQDWVLSHDGVRWVLSAGYVWLHWPLLIAAMAFLTWRAPAVQARLRNAIILSGALGVVLFTVVPMAPPRFMPGFVGTVSDAARRHFLPYPLTWTNQVAAFPSYHVGWTLLACLAVAGVVSNRWVRLAAATVAAVVAVAVVGTGNHYVLDSLTGALLALMAWWVVGGWPVAGRRSLGSGEHRHGAGGAVDAHERTVGDAAGGIRGGDDARAPELAGDDDRMAHLAPDVDHDGLDRHEQRRP